MPKLFCFKLVSRNLLYLLTSIFFIGTLIHAQEDTPLMDEIRLSVGAISLNPFIIENIGTEADPIFEIDDGETTSKAFFSVSYTHRWAWTPRKNSDYWG